MSKQPLITSGLSLIADYGSDYGDSDSDNETERRPEPIDLATFIKSQILEAILTNVVFRANDDLMIIDRNPSFDVYRPRKRELSESSSIVAEPLDLSDDSSTSSSSSSSSESTESSESEEEVTVKTKKDPPKVKGEVTSSELPPIEDLHISVPEIECSKVGTVSSCVHDLVVVQSLPGVPALNLDSVLFLEKGQLALGKVFDVIGPVENPFYCVRFNSAEHIKQKSVVPGMEVFYAPRTEHTAFVFVEQLRRLKGSDASWRHDIEVNEHHQEFSDDEEERKKKKSAKKKVEENKNLSDYKRRAYKPPNQEAQSRNSFYNQPPVHQQQQHQQQGAFYRSNRQYRARNFGPIKWDSIHCQIASTIHTSRPPPIPQPPFLNLPPPGQFRIPPPNPAQPRFPPQMFHFTSPPPPPPITFEDDLKPPGVD